MGTDEITHLRAQISVWDQLRVLYELFEPFIY